MKYQIRQAVMILAEGDNEAPYCTPCAVRAWGRKRSEWPERYELPQGQKLVECAECRAIAGHYHAGVNAAALEAIVDVVRNEALRTNQMIRKIRQTLEKAGYEVS